MMVSLISIVLIKVSKNGTKKILIENIERPDDTIISYIMTYIIPIVTVNNISKYEIIVNILLIYFNRVLIY